MVAYRHLVLVRIYFRVLNFYISKTNQRMCIDIREGSKYYYEHTHGKLNEI